MIFEIRERVALRPVVGELLEVSQPHVSIPSLDVSCFSHTPIPKRTQPSAGPHPPEGFTVRIRRRSSTRAVAGPAVPQRMPRATTMSVRTI